MMTTRSEAEIDRLLAPTAAEYVDEERAVAEEESHGTTASTVFSVRLQPAVYQAVKAIAGRAHLTPSALIRQWVIERAEVTAQETDLATAVATLRRDVERVAALVSPVGLKRS
jgi:predicted transcriptional regulator